MGLTHSEGFEEEIGMWSSGLNFTLFIFSHYVTKLNQVSHYLITAYSYFYLIPYLPISNCVVRRFLQILAAKFLS